MNALRPRSPLHEVWKPLRILALLVVLLLVAVGTWRDRARTTQWRVPLYVGVYPLLADDSPVTKAYVASLDHSAFDSIDQFFVRERRRYGLTLDQPVKTLLRPQAEKLPPQLAPESGAFATLAWSLQLRYWSWRATRTTPGAEDVHIFVLYHDPERTPTVPHSLGLQKGLVGVVYAFADARMTGSNAVIIAHELLHTLGATDKYDPGSDRPSFPDGLGEPQQSPLYPQRFAELMGGRRMLSPVSWETPVSLDEVRIGPSTAREIRWLRAGSDKRSSLDPRAR